MSQATPGKEFERKFLARVDRLPRLFASTSRIEQGYLALSPNQLRIRLKDGIYIVELKGPDDFEHELFRPGREQGEYLLREVATKVSSLIVKDRHTVPAGFDGLVWEIDSFREANAPLVMIEIEMPAKDYALDAHAWPKWIGKEVTGDDRFKNKNLAQHPFGAWEESDRKKIRKFMGL